MNPLIFYCACSCRVNSVISLPDLTLKEAVEYLTQSGENYQQCGANFIQHSTFNEERTKEEVELLDMLPVTMNCQTSKHARCSVGYYYTVCWHFLTLRF